MSKVLTREEILNFSQKPLVIRSKVYGDIKLKGFLSLNDIFSILEFVENKLEDKEFTIAVLNAQLLERENKKIDLSSWDDKTLMSVARKFGKKVFANDLNGQEINNYSNFKTIASKHVDDFNKRISIPIRNMGASAAHALKMHQQTVNTMAALANKIVHESQITNTIKNIEKIALRASDFQKSIENTIVSTASKIARDMQIANTVFANNIRSFNNIQIAGINLSPLFTLIEKNKEDTNEILSLMEELEYELAIDILKDKFSRDLLKIKVSRRKSVVTKKLVQITTSFDFVKRLEILFEIPDLKSRWPSLKQALLAHQTHQYYLSIPVFLAHAEGVFTELLVLRNLAYKERKSVYAMENGSPKTSKKNGKLLKLDTLNQKTTHAKGHFEEYKFIEVTVDAIVSRFVNVRNGIFHGRIHNYGTAANSTKVLLLVFTLAGLLERDLKKIAS